GDDGRRTGRAQGAGKTGRDQVRAYSLGPLREAVAQFHGIYLHQLTESIQMSRHKSPSPITRRDALRRVGNGFGMMAFAGMLGESMLKAGLNSGETGLG